MSQTERRSQLLAVVDDMGEQVRLATDADRVLEPLERMRVGLGGYFDLASRNSEYFLAVHELGAADPEVAVALSGWMSGPEQQLFDALPHPWRTTRTLRLVRLWTAQVVTECLAWLASPDAPPRDELVEHCIHLFRNSLARAVGTGPQA